MISEHRLEEPPAPEESNAAESLRSNASETFSPRDLRRSIELTCSATCALIAAQNSLAARDAVLAPLLEAIAMTLRHARQEIDIGERHRELGEVHPLRLACSRREDGLRGGERRGIEIGVRDAHDRRMIPLQNGDPSLRRRRWNRERATDASAPEETERGIHRLAAPPRRGPILRVRGIAATGDTGRRETDCRGR